MPETVRVSDWIGKDDAMCSLIEGFGDVSEPFLSCCVPNVESDWGSLHLNSFYFEVDSDGAQIIGLEGILAVSNQNAGFSYSAVSNYQIFEGNILLCHYYLKQATE